MIPVQRGLTVVKVQEMGLDWGWMVRGGGGMQDWGRQTEAGGLQVGTMMGVWTQVGITGPDWTLQVEGCTYVLPINCEFLISIEFPCCCCCSLSLNNLIFSGTPLTQKLSKLTILSSYGNNQFNISLLEVLNSVSTSHIVQIVKHNNSLYPYVLNSAILSSSLQQSNLKFFLQSDLDQDRVAASRLVRPMENVQASQRSTLYYILPNWQSLIYYGERQVICFQQKALAQLVCYPGHESIHATCTCPSSLMNILSGLISPTFLPSL